jgi:alpha-beta hydrolase superfamily lysophospholipase
MAGHERPNPATAVPLNTTAHASPTVQSRALVAATRPTLAYALFQPRVEVRGSVLVTPGFGEHIGRYTHVAEAWAGRGFLTCVYDARGHGQSQGLRAHVARFDEYVEDALELLRELARLPEWQGAGTPIAFGHSMGALITIHLGLRTDVPLRGVALSSPFLAQALPTPRWKKEMGRLVSGFWPTYTDRTDITGSMLTNDPERASFLDRDPLRLSRVTARWFTEVEAAQRRAFELAPSFDRTCFCLAAGDDLISDVGATRTWFERIGSKQKELRVVPGQRHELHQETDRAAHIAAFADVFGRWVEDG